jgi:predicted RND superfamily exporter protein
MTAFYRALIRLRLPVIVAGVAVTLWLGWHIPEVQFDTSTASSVPPNDESLRFYDEVIETFGNDLVSVVVVVADGADGVFAPETLTRIDRLTRAIEGIRGVQDVISLTNAVYLKGAEGWLETPPIVAEIPRTPAEVESLREFVLANELFHKTMVSVDGSAAAINVFVRSLPDSQLIDLDIDGKILALIDEHRGSDDVYYAGYTHTRRIVNETMRRDMTRLGPIAGAMIALILAISFRSPVGVLLPVLNVSMAVIWTIGFIGFTGRSISLVSSMLPPLLVAVGSAYSIHVVADFFDVFRREGNAKQAMLVTMREVAMPVLVTALTTVIGFASLTLNEIPNIRTMGMFAATGVVFCALIALTVIPALLSYVRSPRAAGRKRRSSPVVDRVIDRAGHFAGARGLVVIVGTAVLLIVAVIGLLRVKADTDMLSFFRPDSEIRVTTDLIAEHLAGASTFYLAVDGKEPNSMTRPDVLRAIDDVQRYMESLPGIDKTASVVDQVKLLHRALNDDDPAFEIIPEDQGIIDEEILLFSISHDPTAIERYVNGDFSQLSVFVRSRLVGSSEISETLEQIEEYAAQRMPAGVTARPTGTIVVMTASMQAVVAGQRNSLVMAMGIVLLLMTLLFRSLRAGLLAMIPNLVPILLLFGIMGWSGITLNIGTSIIAAMVIGIAVDDTVHYLVRFNRAVRRGRSQQEATLDAMNEAGKPIIFTSMTLCLGFMIMIASDFEVTRWVGMLTAITMITALLADLLVLPAVLLKLPPVFRPGKPASDERPT